MKKTIHSPQGNLVAESLVQTRKKAGLTQRELATRLGREHSFVAHYELGERRVDLAEFYWICTACGATPHKEAAELMMALAELDAGD